MQALVEELPPQAGGGGGEGEPAEHAAVGNMRALPTTPPLQGSRGQRPVQLRLPRLSGKQKFHSLQQSPVVPKNCCTALANS